MVCDDIPLAGEDKGRAEAEVLSQAGGESGLPGWRLRVPVGYQVCILDFVYIVILP